MKRLLTLLGLAAAWMTAFAQNPITSVMYTPDPAPYVHDGKLYMFVDHDEDDATNYKMKDWVLFSTEDMVNWTYLGTPMSTATFSWALQGNRAWASQAVERNGKWYWYCCCMARGYGECLAVAVADDPQGPWEDAIGGPLCYGNGFIDPTVWIDDDGSAWLFWGLQGFFYGQLNDDMISFKDGYKEVPGYPDPEAFGPFVPRTKWSLGRVIDMTSYEEGPWVCKRDGTYYAIYPAGGIPEFMAYSTAPTINGPWKYGGQIMDRIPNSITIHGGYVNYKGHDYMFYHTASLPNGSSYHRSAAVEEFKFNPDGTIPFIPATKEGPDPIGTINPYVTVEAETMAESYGVKVDRLPGTRHYVTSIHNGDWIKVREVDFGDEEATMVVIEMLNFKNAGSIDFFIDEMIEGRPIATVPVNNDNMMITAPVRPGVAGKHDVYLLFHGGDEELFDLDWWKFNAHVNMPIIQTKYTADPAPMVYNGKVYLYTTHDEDYANGFVMKDWLLYTSEDMVNWQDHGAVASLKDFKWYDGDNGAWALQVVERNGKFYMYCPIHGHGIGVLVADSPYGPFVDPIGEPLVWQREHWEDIDPTVWVDDNGQAYMYWGNPNVYWAELNDDMISLASDIHKLDYKIDYYQEGPWFYKRNGKYYLAFASTCCPEGIGYAMSDSPTGPWKSMGHIMDRTWRTRGNHPGIIDYKGRSYVFGLNYEIMHLETFRHHERRSVSAAEMHYNPDGSIQKVPYWQDNVLEQLQPFNPFRKVEAETMSWGYGLKTQKNGSVIVVTDIDAGEYLKVSGVDFKKGAKTLQMNVSSVKPAAVEIRLDSEDGPIAGTMNIRPGSGYKTESCSLKGASGVHDLFFVFKGDGFTWDWWQMK